MLTVHGVTHPGRVRKINEDGFYYDVQLGLYLVADGLGGHNAGEIASRLALESVLGFIQRTREDEEFTWPRCRTTPTGSGPRCGWPTGASSR
jgi:serine/threonine protein phosphatase PrpC